MANTVPGPKLVKKTLLIPEEEVKKFEAKHRGHGDFTWFVRESLRRYNELNDTNPDELITLAVNEITLKAE